MFHKLTFGLNYLSSDLAETHLAVFRRRLVNNGTGNLRNQEGGKPPRKLLLTWIIKILLGHEIERLRLHNMERLAGAYDHVSHARLLHNLKKRKISNWIIQWVKSFLKERRSSIAFEEKTSAVSMINAGVPQRFPVSLILYLFFNADLLDICEQQKRKTTSIEFVDDVNVLTYSTSTEENCKTLKKLHEVFTT